MDFNMNALEALWVSQLDNDFLIAGALLGLAGITIAALRKLWIVGSRLIWRQIAWTVRLDNSNEAYAEILEWLAAEGAFKHARRMRFEASRPEDRDTPDQKTPAARLTPDNGWFWVWRDGALALLDRTIDDKPIPGRRERLETLNLTFIWAKGWWGAGGRGRAVFERWAQDAQMRAMGKDAGWPRLFAFASWGGWDEIGRARPRALSTICTSQNAGERLLDDARQFIAREEWYAQRGAPWRRGYLLYGPPGTGKSSLIRAIASELGLNLAIVDLMRKGMDDSQLREALSKAPANAILALEDVDAAFCGREKGDAASGVSFSGLLNALDGLAAQEGRMVFMTTNHRDKLDAALIRPGRADLHIRLGLAQAEQAAQIYSRFFPEAEFPGAQAEAAHMARLPGKTAPAAIQAALLASPEDAHAAATAVRKLYNPPHRAASGVAAE